MYIQYHALYAWVGVCEQMSQLNCHHGLHLVMVLLRQLSGWKIHWITIHFHLTVERFHTPLQI